MSSHHIIREDQEPAIVICTPDFSIELAFQLLEWSPRVIVVENALNAVLALGIKIDVLICEDQHLKFLREKMQFQGAVQFLPFNDTGINLILKGVSYLSTYHDKALNILSHSEEQLFSFLPELPIRELVVWTPDTKWSYCRSAHFTKWVPQHTRFAFFKVEGVNLDAKNVIADAFRNEFRTYRVVNDGSVEFTGDASFWIGEFID